MKAAKDPLGRVGDLAWSPDGQFLAFSLSNLNGTRSLNIWGLADQQLHRMTGELFPVTEPAWDPEGKYLYALSRRDYAPQISDLEFDYAGNRNTDVVAYALRKDVAHPFPPESDEVGAAPEKKDDGEKKDDDKKKEDGKKADKPAEAKAPVAVRIDFDGFEQRGVRVPVPADNLAGLEAVKGFLLYSKGQPFVYGEVNGRRPAGASLWIFDLKKRQESELLPDAQGWVLSQDGNKILTRAGQGPAATFQLIDAKPKATEKKTVSTKELFVDRIPAEEWREVYDETWRRFRDFFYVKNMHGYDWKALREQYRPWLQHVTHRSDLTYVLTELISELNIGHTYTEGGDQFLPERAKVGLPGARIELDAAAGRYRLAHIYRGHNEEPKYRSPLTEVGVDAREGDYILAIDGVELKADDSPYRLLRNKTFTVTLTLNGKPTFEGARQVSYQPIQSEASLRYLDFVLRSKETVDKLSGGKVGYLHIPDMGGARPVRVHQVVLPADPQGGPGRGCPRQWRRQHQPDDHRAPRPEVAGHTLRLRQRRTDHLSVHRVPRPHGGAHQRDERQRRRHLPLPLPVRGPRPPHRQAHLGRRRGRRQHAAHRRRQRLRPALGHQRAHGRMDHRGRGRDP